MSSENVIFEKCKDKSIDAKLIIAALKGFRAQNQERITPIEDLKIGQHITTFIKIRDNN